MISLPQNYPEYILQNSNKWIKVLDLDNSFKFEYAVNYFYKYHNSIAEIFKDGGLVKYYLVNINSNFAFLCEHHLNELVSSELCSFNASLKEILSSKNTVFFRNLIKVVFESIQNINDII